VDPMHHMSFDTAEMSLGVEEKYLVIDPATRMVVPQAPMVVEGAAAELGERVSTEVTQFQVEAKTEPCTAVSELYHQLQSMRSVVAAVAHGLGLGVIASGTPVLGDVVRPGSAISGARSSLVTIVVISGSLHPHPRVTNYQGRMPQPRLAERVDSPTSARMKRRKDGCTGKRRRLRNGRGGGGRCDISAYIGTKASFISSKGPDHSVGPLLQGMA
jgi:glutamate-cysteine ligase